MDTNKNIFNMTISELKNEIETLSLNDKELKAFNDGKNMIDKLYELQNIEANRVAYYLIVYLLLKGKMNGRF